MIGRYALPSDDLAGAATSVVASAEDSGYVATNLIAPSGTGHLNVPSRPAKLTTYDGYWELTFEDPIAVGAIHLVYPNLDAGLDVTLEPDGGTPIAITIPAQWENGWWPSPCQEFDTQTSDVWRLSINEDNSLLPQIGRLLLYASLRDLGDSLSIEQDVRWGVVEDEEQGQIVHLTEGQVETFFELFGPRRRLSGELAIQNQTASDLLTLFRTARNSILPWTLVPDYDNIGDSWFVRFEENRWQRTRETVNHNIFPFRVRELSRGLPWP
jgi:hypothetical protein